MVTRAAAASAPSIIARLAVALSFTASVYGGPAHAGELIKASGRNGVTESMFLDSPSATPPWVVVLFAGDDGAVRVTGIARIVRRQDRTGSPVGINRRAHRAAIARIIRRKHRAGRRQCGRTLRVRSVFIVQRIEIRCRTAAIVDRTRDAVRTALGKN